MSDNENVRDSIKESNACSAIQNQEKTTEPSDCLSKPETADVTEEQNIILPDAGVEDGLPGTIDDNNPIANEPEASVVRSSDSVQTPVNPQPVVQSGDPAQCIYQQPTQHPPIQQPSYAYPNEDKNQKKSKSKGKAAFLAIACVLLVSVVGIFAIVLSRGSAGMSNDKNGLTDVPHVSAVSSADTESEGLSAAEVYQKVFKSSVSVLAYKQSSGELGVIGSGVICQEDSEQKYSYIVTCAHVINDSSYNIKVELWDGSVHTAEVVNYDNTNDIGVIRIAKTGLTIAEFGDSDEIQPGATVYAIGSPYSSKFAGTFTRGMVSATNRLVTTQTSYQLCCIQHDAPINHGNSGGALVNAFGQVIGINALKITAEGYEGLGFSVPSSTVIKVINSIIESGIAPKAPKLGISYVQAIYYSQFLSDFIEENNLPAGSILIADITEDSSLANTDLQVNDIVTAVNGEALTTPDMLVQLIQNSDVGDSFELTVVRIIMNEDGSDYIDTQTFTVTATLVEKKDTEESSSQDAQEDFYEYFGDDSGNYEDFYEYFYDYFYGNGINPDGDNGGKPGNDNQFTIPE